MLRLPLEVAPLFRAWLDAHYPLRAAHIMSLVNQVRGGRDYSAQFGSRMRGSGAFADLIALRFKQARARHGMDQRMRLHGEVPLDVSRFVPPSLPGAAPVQPDLFG